MANRDKRPDPAAGSRPMEPEHQQILEGGGAGGSTSYAGRGRRGDQVPVRDLEDMNPLRKSTGHGPVGHDGR